jgi:hypothetical protein
VAAAEAIVQLARRMLAAGAGGVRLKLAELP